MLIGAGIGIPFQQNVLARLLGSAEFYAQLTKSLVLNRGTGSPTFTRASTATVQNNDGYLVQALSGEARFQGARRVRNLLATNSENATTDSPLALNASATATVITTTAAGNSYYYKLSNGVIPALGKAIVQLELSGSGSVNIMVQPSVSGAGFVKVNLNVVLTSTPTFYDIVVTNNATAQAFYFGIDGRASEGASAASQLAGAITVTKWMLEDVTAQTTQTAGEYVSVGVPADWAGTELVTNGTFDTDLSGWTLTQTATAGVPTWDAGSMKMNSDGSGFSRADQELVTTAGTGYVVSGILSGTTPLTIAVGTSQGGATLLNQTIGSTGLFTYTFTATGASTWIRLQDGGGTANSLDNISVKPAYYHGSMADGVKCFATDLSGNPIPAATMLGYQAEGARTNLCLQSNAFTTTWSASGTPTPTQNVVGPDGATSAWTLTDNNVASIDGVGQTIALTAATYTYSIFVKKTTGAQSSYPVITVDNGASRIAACTVDTTNGVATVWTAYTGLTVQTSSASCVSHDANYWRVSLTFLATAENWVHYLLAAATANATQSTGTFDVTAQGSAVFYGAQVELGSFASSYIPTTTVAVTRAADQLTYPSAGNISGAVGAAYCEIKTGSVCGRSLSFNAGGTGMIDAGTGDSLSFRAYDETNVVNVTVGDSSASTVKQAIAWGGSTLSAARNGTTASGSFDGNMSPTGISIGGTTGGELNGTIRNVRIWNRQLSASELRAITS